MKIEKSPSRNSPEHRGLLYILSAFLGFLFVRSFSKSRSPVRIGQSFPNSDHPEDNTGKAANRAQNLSSLPVRVIVESVPPPISPSDEEKAESNRKKRRKTIKFWAELIVGFFICLYTVVSCNQWYEMQNTNEITRDIQSARLVVLNNFSCADMSTDKSIASHTVIVHCSFQIQNDGHSVAEALNPTNGCFWQPGNRAVDPDLSEFISTVKANPDGPNLGQQSIRPYEMDCSFNHNLIGTNYRSDEEGNIFYIFVAIPYLDMFKRPQHLVTECVQYRPWKSDLEHQFMRCYFGHQRK
jgi:hypothetical protein